MLSAKHPYSEVKHTKLKIFPGQEPLEMFACSYDASKYAQKWSLTTHMKKKHQEVSRASQEYKNLT